MEDEYGGPFMPRKVRKNPGSRLTIADLATAVTPVGGDREKMISQLRHYAKQGYLHPVEQETEGRQSYLYLPDQCLTAEVLVRMGEFGIAKVDAAMAASRAIHVWRIGDFDGDTPPADTPGMHVIREYEVGVKDWALELWFLRSPSGNPIFTARLFARERLQATGWEFGDNLEKRSVFAVDLGSVLDRIHPHNRPTVN